MSDNQLDLEAPAAIASEMAVLGACLTNERGVEASGLTGVEFYRPAHQVIFETMVALLTDGKPCDPASVLAALGKGAAKVGGGPYLHTLMTAAAAGNITYHAKIVRGKWRLRLIIEEGQRTVQRGLTAHANGDDAEEVIEATARALEHLRQDGTDDDLSTLMTLSEFVDRPIPPKRWVVGDLIARQERLVLTGMEGVGKSVLGRQFAVAAAAGLHPFTLAPREPVRVLAIDLENPEDIMIDSWGQLRTAAAQRGRPVEDGRLVIDRKMSGLDLANVEDRRWLDRRVELVRPDLLVIGPAYKMYVGGDTQREETLARMVTSHLDRLRESTGCALILEHHAPHGDSSAKKRSVRPFGSSLWLRWPEFGWGIRLDAETTGQSFQRRTVEVSHWRGGRTYRNWPERLETGAGWPWMEAPPAASGTGSWAS